MRPTGAFFGVLAATIMLAAAASGVMAQGKYPNRPIRLLYFGRVLPYKGLDIMLEALPLIRSSRPNVELELWCSGEIGPCFSSAPSVRHTRTATIAAPINKNRKSIRPPPVPEGIGGGLMCGTCGCSGESGAERALHDGALVAIADAPRDAPKDDRVGRLERKILDYPIQVAVVLLIASLIGYGIGALQIRWFAELPTAEAIKVCLLGIVTGLVGALFAYLYLEWRLAPLLRHLEFEDASIATSSRRRDSSASPITISPKRLYGSDSR